MISYAELLFALDSTDNVVVMTDLQGKITYANHAFEVLYGYTRQEAIGQKPSLLKSGLHDDAFYKDMWETIQNGETWEGVFRNKTRDNRLIWEQARISPIKNDKGINTGYIAVKVNISYKKDLEAQIEQEQFLLNELFSNSPIGIIICDPIFNVDNEITDVLVLKANPVASTILNRLGIVGMTFRKLLPSAGFDKERFNQMLSEKLNLEIFLNDVDKYLSFSTFPLDNNRFCSSFVDVTSYKLTIKALIESEERYSMLVEDSPALICRFDINGSLIYQNQNFAQSFGIDAHRLKGMRFYMIFPEEIRNCIRTSVNSLTNDHSQHEFEVEVVINGRHCWQKWIIRALFDHEGNIFEYQAVGMDFSDIKEAQKALIDNRNKLDAIFNNSVIGITVVNPLGYFKMVNSRMTQMFGYSADEFCQMRTIEITHPDSVELSGSMLDKIFKEEIDQYNIVKRYIRKDGSLFWADLYVSPIRNANGDIVEVAGLIADVNQKKEIEMQLIEDERKLKESNATKDKLFSIIAHDIKNPFHAILGFATLLNERLDEFSQDEVKLFVSKILEAGENTYKLLEDLLTWGRSQLGKLRLTPQEVHPAVVVEEIFMHYLVLAQSKKITLENNIPPDTVVYADFDMVKFIFRNLIHNGIKFTGENGMINCSVKKCHQSGCTMIAVTDTGIGIHSEKIDKLFDINSFLSTDGTASEKGTGLGLSLTYEMVGLNNGTIKVESKVGEGTTFSISLPSEAW
jgi:PAS domain S-box-containing protein